MTENPDRRKAVLAQAMAILRATRARFDPALLSFMRERLSALVPESMMAAAPPPKNDKDEVSKRPDDSSEKIDRQKISKIVLEYMKLRQDQKTRH